MSKPDSDCRCARCGHTFGEHEMMIAEFSDYRHAWEKSHSLAECLDFGGFISEEAEIAENYVPGVALGR